MFSLVRQPGGHRMSNQLPDGCRLEHFVEGAAAAGLRVDDSGASQMTEVLRLGHIKLGELRPESVSRFRRAFHILISASIAEAAVDRANFVGGAHIIRALKRVCPLFPFC